MKIIKICKKIFFVLLALGVVFLYCSAAIAASQEDLDRVQRELKSERLKLKAAREKEAGALNNLYRVNRQLKDAKEDLERTKLLIDRNGKKIAVLSSDLKDLETDFNQKSGVLSKRISEAYKSGGALSLLDVLFSSTSITDFVNRQYYFERMISKDLALISEMKDKARSIEESKKSLRVAVSEMNAEAKVIDRRKGEIQDQAEEKEKLYQSLKERREEYEKRVKELENSSALFEGLIKRAGDERTRDRKAAPRGTGRMIWPAPGRVVSGFGYRRHPIWGGIHLHTGIDIGAAFGEPVRSADGGEIIFSGWWDGYGKAVVIDHGKMISTVYGHLSRIYVEAGQRIEKGQIIGLVGTTGFSTGPHLHFEVRVNGKPTDPMKYLM